MTDTGSFGLIGIEPSLIDAINNNNKTNYRNTDFSIKKDGTDHARLSYGVKYESLPTLGSFCYLIANKKVKPYQVKNFMTDLTNVKDSLDIDFVNFKDNYEIDYIKNQNKTLASLLLSLTGGVALGTLILSFIFALISSFWHDKLSNKLVGVIRNIPDDSIPDQQELERKKVEDRSSVLESPSALTEEEAEEKMNMFDLYYTDINKISPFISPYIKFNQIALINKKIVTGMSEIVHLRQHINTALDNGKLNTDHFNDLLVRTDTIMDKLRKSLFLRLHELFNRKPDFGGINKNDEQLKRLLLHYVTSSYLNFDDYKKLIS